jgi:two-component system NtrC family sensor kinase
VNIEVEIENDIQVPLDFRRMQQVLLNLMLNGIQAMKEGGKLTITAFHRRDDLFCFEVRDTGCGIPKEYLSKIFDPFFSTKEGLRKKESDQRPYDGILNQPGTGLGLAICHGIIQKHGGQISVASEIGQGTAFTICLPIGTYNDTIL